MGGVRLCPPARFAAIFAELLVDEAVMFAVELNVSLAGVCLILTVSPFTNDACIVVSVRTFRVRTSQCLASPAAEVSIMFQVAVVSSQLFLA